MQTQSPFLNQQLGKLKTHLSCKFHTTILGVFYVFRTIKQNTFSVQADLEYLDLSHNNISQLEPYFFQVRDHYITTPNTFYLPSTSSISHNL